MTFGVQRGVTSEQIPAQKSVNPAAGVWLRRSSGEAEVEQIQPPDTAFVPKSEQKLIRDWLGNKNKNKKIKKKKKEEEKKGQIFS